MPQPLFAHLWAWLAAAVPLVILGGSALLGGALGDWGRGALLAYAAVLLAFVGGSLAGAPPGIAASVALAGSAAALLVAFACLVLGGGYGLLVLAAAYSGVAVFAVVRPMDALPWPLLVIAAVACAAVGLRGRL